MGLPLSLRVALLALAAAAVACGQAFTTGGPEGGAPDGPDDRTTRDSPPDRASDRSLRDVTDELVMVDVAPPPADASCTPAGGAASGICAPSIVALGGWEYVSFEPMSSACPAGYGVPSTVELQGGPGTCGCTCGTSPPTCASNDDLHYGTTGCAATNASVPTSGACTPLATPIGTVARLMVSAVPSVTTCLPPMLSNGIPAEPSALVCRASPGTGCRKGFVCLPVATSGQMCIQHSEDVKCPSIPTLSLTKISVATSYADTRGCSLCSCTPPSLTADCVTQVELFTDTACKTTPTLANANGACDTVASASTGWAAAEITATPPLGSAPCSASMPKPTGSETPVGPSTLCCL